MSALLAFAEAEAAGRRQQLRQAFQSCYPTLLAPLEAAGIGVLVVVDEGGEAPRGWAVFMGNRSRHLLALELRASGQVAEYGLVLSAGEIAERVATSSARWEQLAQQARRQRARRWLNWLSYGGATGCCLAQGLLWLSSTEQVWVGTRPAYEMKLWAVAVAGAALAATGALLSRRSASDAGPLGSPDALT